MEKRFQTTVIEKDTIFASLEEALDRIHTLERHIREQDSKLQSTMQHLDRVQQENSALYEKIVSFQSLLILSNILETNKNETKKKSNEMKFVAGLNTKFTATFIAAQRNGM